MSVILEVFQWLSMTPPMLANIITWVAVKQENQCKDLDFFPGRNFEGRFCCRWRVLWLGFTGMCLLTLLSNFNKWDLLTNPLYISAFDKWQILDNFKENKFHKYFILNRLACIKELLTSVSLCYLINPIIIYS